MQQPVPQHQHQTQKDKHDGDKVLATEDTPAFTLAQRVFALLHVWCMMAASTMLLCYGSHTVLLRSSSGNKPEMANCAVSPQLSFNLKIPKESIISLSLVVNSRHWLAINTTCCSPSMASGDLVRTEWWMDGGQVLHWGKMSLTGSVGGQWG